MKPMTLPELTQEYILTHDLRPDTVKIYWAATKSYVRFFGDCLACETTHRDMLDWRRSELERISKRSWNTYSSHLRTIYGYATEHGLIDLVTNPLKNTRVVPPKRPKKTVANDATVRARNWLKVLAAEERATAQRTEITPAWFWLSVFETFYYTGLRLNALICLRYADVYLGDRLIRVRGETEKTHREFLVPIPDGLMAQLETLMNAAKALRFQPGDQLFNVNRFSGHYHRQEMNSHQVEAMYKKLTAMTGVRMTPHRFRHTIASELMTLPERNIYLTKKLLNHSNIATTMDYIEPDYDMMRAVMNERGKRPAKISYMAKTDASVRADRHRTISAPVKDLTPVSPIPERTTIAGSASENVLGKPPAQTVPLTRKKQSAPLNSHLGTSKHAAPDISVGSHNDMPSPLGGDEPAVSNLPFGCSSPEDLLRSLGELTRWVQNNIAGGGAGAEPVIEDRPVPSQDARHLRPEMLELAGWIGRSTR
ncbi:site-specific integrase [Pseudomonas syringae]|uniref:site-specific integrase n=1 Tax=Pseudomonas syringae TaxID=317 RepID=UPI0018E66078|nr:site-specific integrase [Pseudomonas syringae]MBI6748970.1 site-specific integrase [Pseudomonas syringae]MBI6771010.1 site-specific integrase [Pseudomonas syringae]MBI6776067.1 site-specific integrase [Pseudomonas syringae]MBI6792394.1 site-specific integrase [Pseudomonas syringae]MBI6802789.1 site-specific integrase [Pseudomonas syringae]